MSVQMKTLKTDIETAMECALSFSRSTDISCVLADTSGNVIQEIGYGYDSCELCAVAGQSKQCDKMHCEAMYSAESLGGKYIYLCEMGLSFCVSPITKGVEGKLTAGPFLLVGQEEYLQFDLKEKHIHGDSDTTKLRTVLEQIPKVSPEKVTYVSNVLFMLTSFLHTTAATSELIAQQYWETIQRQVSAYALEQNKSQESLSYPYATEQILVDSIVKADRITARRALNELLGFILFSSGEDLLQIKAMIHELLTVISRAAVYSGVSGKLPLRLSRLFYQRSHMVESMEALCYLTNRVLNLVMDSVFPSKNVKHVEIIRKSLEYIHSNYHRKIALEDIAGHVYLSPSYFSSVFAEETGCSFISYLNKVRIDESKRLLLRGNKAADVAVMVGFEDQSYFAKVFKKNTGKSPNQYREIGGLPAKNQ